MSAKKKPRTFRYPQGNTPPKTTKKAKVEIACEHCGKTFERWPSGIKDHNFCCPACKTAWRGSHGETRECLYCGKAFLAPYTNLKKTYCSPACKQIHARIVRDAEKKRNQEMLRQAGDRDVASEGKYGTESFSGLWRGHGFDKEFHPFGAAEVFTGF